MTYLDRLNDSFTAFPRAPRGPPEVTFACRLARPRELHGNEMPGFIGGGQKKCQKERKVGIKRPLIAGKSVYR